MKNLGNIFSFATKELTQDAFLRWLLENFNSTNEDVRYVSRLMITSFLNMQNLEDIEIENVITKTQENKIDILVFINTTQTKYLIAIEDKTYSIEHSGQLDKYSEYLQKRYSDYQKHYVFYKTSPMSRNEIENISSKGWKVFDIDRIHNLFSTLAIEVNHYLLVSYIDYLKSLFTSYRGDLPNDITQWDTKQWRNFTDKQNLKLPKNIERKIDVYRNQYVNIAYNHSGQWEKRPYLEFSSKHMSTGNFEVRIFIYGIDSITISHNLIDWKSQINKSSLFRTQKFIRQIGISKVKEKAENIELLEAIMMKYIEEFNTIFECN